MRGFRGLFPYLIIIILFILGVYFLSGFNFQTKDTKETGYYFELSVDPKIHNDYGLTYPSTYEFLIPSRYSSGLNVYKRYTDTQEWQHVSEKKNADFFNGLEAARFDYSNNKVYVSVGFDDISDKIQLKLTDDLGQIIKLKYLGISKYYDNRKAVVVVVGDDWGLWGDKRPFYAAFNVLRSRNIWFTPAAVTQKGISDFDWDELQEEINRGYVEVAAHSRIHPPLPYDDYDSEIGGCKEDIINNLDLPYKKGSQEYVYAWIRPYGQGDSIVRSKLGEYKYLVDRLSCCFIKNDFAGWDSENGLYGRMGYSFCLDKGNLEEGNKKFDEVIKIGGIYSVYMHPYNGNWEEGSWELQHFDYIKNKTNLWYTGLGYLYMYHFVKERNIISVSGFSSL